MRTLLAAACFLVVAPLAPRSAGADAGLPSADELAPAAGTETATVARHRRAANARPGRRLRSRLTRRVDGRRSLAHVPVAAWPRARLPDVPRSISSAESPEAPLPHAGASRPVRVLSATLTEEVSPATPRPPFVVLSTGMSASTRRQFIDLATGEQVHYRVRAFGSIHAAVSLAPLASTRGPARGLGVEAMYERALSIETTIDQRPVDASADHLALALRWDLRLPGGIVVRPRAGWDLTRFPLGDNDELSGIEYSSLAAGATVELPLLARRLWLEAAGTVVLPLGLGPAEDWYGPAVGSSGYAATVALSGTVAGQLRVEARLTRTVFDVTFGEAHSDDATTTFGCGLSLGL